MDEVLEGLAVAEDDVCPSDSWLCEMLDGKGPGFDGGRGLGVCSSSSESEVYLSGGDMFHHFRIGMVRDT